MNHSWNKGEKIQLSAHFSGHEFECRCNFDTCNTQIIAKELINKLEQIRANYKMPIFVTSGFRCHKYQEFLRSQGYETTKVFSQHELGRAADITANDIVKLTGLAEKEFMSIGIGKLFIHVDLRPESRRWQYAKRRS